MVDYIQEAGSELLLLDGQSEGMTHLQGRRAHASLTLRFPCNPRVMLPITWGFFSSMKKYWKEMGPEGEWEPSSSILAGPEK